MIVRLKAAQNSYRTGAHMFQFYDSPIKSGYKTAIVAFDPFSFNSMIVRLKAVYARQG